MFLSKLERINDPRQWWKVKHTMIDVVAIVLMATLANANEWEEMQIFAVANEVALKKYLKLENGIPSQYTLERVMSIIEPKVLTKIQLEWHEILNGDQGEKIKRILNIDGKTMCSSGNKNQKALHVVSAWSKEDGICFGQTVVDDKSNEICAIPQLLEALRINDQVVTIDAMGTQTVIAAQIIRQKGDYVLAVKGNQPNLHNDIIEYFNDEEFKNRIKSGQNSYKVTKEKARGQVEKREYYQTDDISWFEDKAKWKGLKSIGMVETTIEKDGKISNDKRYYISSLPVEIELFEKAARGHWSIESMHWHLDVTFREDNNSTLDKTAALNLNIIRKFALAILKLIDVGRKTSLKHKRYWASVNPTKILEQVFAL